MSRDRFTERVRERLEGDSGFTLVELLVVLEILSILIIIAVPSFLSTAAKARIVTAQSNVQSAVTAADAYYLDTLKNPTPSTFGGLSGAKLRLEAPGVGPNVKAGAKTVKTANDAFCVQDSEDGGKTFYRYEGGVGGSTTILLGACPVAYAVT